VVQGIITTAVILMELILPGVIPLIQKRDGNIVIQWTIKCVKSQLNQMIVNVAELSAQAIEELSIRLLVVGTVRSGLSNLLTNTTEITS